MKNLLHLSASPRGSASESVALATTFLAAVEDVHEGVTVDTFDLWDGTLPPFGPEATAAKMAVFAGEEPVGAAAEAWRAIRETYERFTSADAYLFSVPMWNHGIPYVLKQLIDVVSQPGVLFTFDPEHGYTGLLDGKKAAVVYTSGVYGPGASEAFGTDFQAPYVEAWLRWAGVRDITTVELRPGLVTEDPAAAREAAHAAARDAGKSF